jgi:hypothetical protein
MMMEEQMTEAKITVVLNGPGGRLATEEIERNPRLPIDHMHQDIQRAIAGWTLSPGDTIEILGNEEAFNLFG